MQSKFCNSENCITTRELVEQLREHFKIEKSSLFVAQESVSLKELLFSSDLDTEGKLLLYGRKRGWLEEIDQLRKDEPVEKMAAARILHQFLRIELREEDEADWNRATELKDLYDCHTCVNHIAQMYVKGIVAPRESTWEETGSKIFGAKDSIENAEAVKMIERMFHKEKRLNVVRGKNFAVQNIGDAKELKGANATDENAVHTSAKPISFEEAKQLMKTGVSVVLIDVRTMREAEEKTLPSSKNIPLPQILKQPHLVGADKNQTYICYCEQGYQSRLAANCLLDHGYQKVFYISVK